MPLQHRRHSARRYVAQYAASIGCSFGFLSALHLERPYHLVQAHTPPDVMVFAAAAAKMMGARVLLDIHDPMPEAMGTKFGLGRRSMARRVVSLQEQISTRFADHVLTVTDQVAEVLIRRGVDRHKLSVVMNLSDPQVFAHEPASLRHPIGTDPLRLVFMGTLTRQYGVDLLIDSLPYLLRALPSIQLTIIGDGEERGVLERQASALGLNGSITFVPGVPIARIPEVALPADIGVAPHRVDELYDMCFPSKIYDYLRLGLPVVAARTKSLVAYYGESTLRLFPAGDSRALADCVLDLATHPERVEQMHAQADAFMARLNWRTEKRKYLDIVERLCRDRPVRSPERRCGAY
jgi:glycosyltransferase involved in cell wall biosynthesis